MKKKNRKHYWVEGAGTQFFNWTFELRFFFLWETTQSDGGRLSPIFSKKKTKNKRLFHFFRKLLKKNLKTDKNTGLTA